MKEREEGERHVIGTEAQNTGPSLSPPQGIRVSPQNTFGPSRRTRCVLHRVGCEGVGVNGRDWGGVTQFFERDAFAPRNKAGGGALIGRGDRYES